MLFEVELVGGWRLLQHRRGGGGAALRHRPYMQQATCLQKSSPFYPDPGLPGSPQSIGAELARGL